MPGMDAHYSVKPLSYFAHLLGYEGEGSLMLQLKEKGWITSSQQVAVRAANYRDFTVSCTLTPNGLDHIDDIVQAVFQYLHDQTRWHG